MERRLEPELLDSLPPDHCDARRSRRDLRVTNRVMGNWRWMEEMLPPLVRPREAVLEIGAGTGDLARRLQAFVPEVDGLDPWPRPHDWPAERHWHQTTAEAFDGWGAYPVIIGNLIFHQFDGDSLRMLGRQLNADARLILACEPARRRCSQTLFAVAAPLLGANHVTRHDGHISIAAGFRQDELPQLLELDPGAWQWRVQTTLMGAYRMIAQRN